MKLLFIFMTTCLVQVSASTYAQRITLVKKNADLISVFDQISMQSGLNFLVTNELLKGAKPVDINVKDEEVREVLDKIFKNQPLSYTIEDNAVIVSRKTPSFLDRVLDRFAAIDVRGVVVDGESGQGLAGASVKVKGTGRATTTGSNGEFYLRGVDEDAVIEISFVGFKSVELKAVKDMGTIKLEISFSDLQEVEINKGYYTEKRKLSTGSVGRVAADDIGKQPVSNPLAALYGRVPGLVITQQTGVPGGNFEIQIRGQNSLRKSAEDNGNIPLYVIDGVPFGSTTLNANTSIGAIYTPTKQLVSTSPGSSPLNSINPADIESIEILKDADATAIYGSRGANGVILITTKKGKSGKMKIDVNVYTGAGQVTRMMKLLSTEQYIEMRKEAFANDNKTTYPANARDINGTWDQNKYTDWQKELIGGTAKTTNAQLSFSGGTSNLQYRFGGGYNKNGTVFPGDFADQRGSAHMSLSTGSANQKFKSNLSVNYSIGNSNLFAKDLTDDALKLAPNAPDLLDENGNLNWTNVTTNALQYTKQPYSAKNNNLIANSNLSYELLQGLVFKTSLGYTASNRKEIRKTPLSSLLPSQQATATNMSMFGNSSISSWIIEPQLNWIKQVKKSVINLLLASTFQRQFTEAAAFNVSAIPSEALMESLTAGTLQVSTFSNAEYKYNAVFGRVNYNYADKYLINIIGRRDGSSRFGPGKQFANFAAAGLAWIFSEEDIVKHNLSALSHGKLRGSYGTTGSDQTPNYGFLDLFNATPGTYDGLKGLNPIRLYNPDFAWEENRKLELALELGFIQDKIMFSAAWYRNISSNQLVGYPLPPTAGFPIVQMNLDAAVKNTGWEFELNTVNVKNENLSWSSNFNLSFPKNKLVSYPNLAGSSYALQYIVGEPLAISSRYEYVGVNPVTGFYEVRDFDNNSSFNTLDRQIIKFIGEKFSGGLSNTLQWKGIQLDVLFQFVKQEGLNYLTNNFTAPGLQVQNQSIEVLNRWRKSGDNSDIQKFTTVSNNEYSLYSGSNRAITDASFIRLKNLSFSYNLPSALIDKIGVKGARVFVQGQNLFTLTHYKGLDPESQGSALPPLRILTGGIQLTF